MSFTFRRMVVVAAVFTLGAGASWAQPAPAENKASASSPSSPSKRPVIYRAAAGSAPAARVTGGSRGAGDAAVRLDVLAPDETGLTTLEQPSLFWYQSRPASASFELTLLDENETKPILQVKVDQSTKAGIHRLKLADHGVKLQPGVEYRWVVALVVDPANRSTDLVASGFITRVESPKGLQDQLAKASPAERPALYAEAGIWHDALASLSDLIEAQPQGEWRAQRANLLRQVGLSFAAGSEAPSK